MGVPTKFFTFVDSQAEPGKLTAARLNGDFDPLYACLDPSVGGLEDTNVKSGAKIVCTDRSHTITGIWTFTTAAVFPDASIPGAKLAADVNADTVDSLHATAFAVAAKGVTGGDSHDHADGDGAVIPEGGLSLSDVATGDVSTAAHGFAPKAPNDVTKFLRGDATWAGPAGYALPVISAALAAPTDEYSYYFGGVADAPNSAGSADKSRLYIPKAGTITTAYIFWYAETAGTGEEVSVYIRLNNTSDTLIAALSNTNATKVFSNVALSIAVAQGDYIEIKMVCPAWATNPAAIHLGGNIYVE